MRPGARLLATALVAVLLAPGLTPELTWAGPKTDSIDRSTAEERLAGLLAEIQALKAGLESARSEHQREQQRVKAIDLEIQRANLDLRALRGQQATHRAELDRLQSERDDYLAQLEARMGQLAEQLRWAYRADRQSRIMLVLNQDQPGKVGRMLAYYDYFARAQSKRIALLHEALSRLQQLGESIDGELARLLQLGEEQENLLDDLGGQREERALALARLDERIGDETSRLQELERDRRDLETLIERLSDVLADIPTDLGDHVGIGGQKGRLPMPLQGPVQHAFGQSRGGGLRWQGWLIGAEAGAEVAAIAYGRVAFADWLRGYGLLMIIDHGDGFMSLYGNNESLLQEVGAWVEPGTVIGLVGANPGSGQGLYFELRKGGKAVDPAAWLLR